MMTTDLLALIYGADRKFTYEQFRTWVVAQSVRNALETFHGGRPSRPPSAQRLRTSPPRTLATQKLPIGDGLTVRRDEGSDPGAGYVTDIPVAAASVRWERPTARSFWNSLADPEREALAAAGVEEVFRPGAVLCRAGEDTSQVMIIDSGWVKVSIRESPEVAEKILAVRSQGDVVGERAALTTSVRSATVTALDEVSAMVVPAERFAEFLRGHPRAAEVLERQVTERREEDRMRLFPGDRVGAERRLAWLLLDLAQRRGGYQATAFTLPMSQQELAGWAGTSADAVGRFLRSWRDRGIIARSERSRRLTVIDLDGLAALCDAGTPPTRADRLPNETQAFTQEGRPGGDGDRDHPHPGSPGLGHPGHAARAQAAGRRGRRGGAAGPGAGAGLRPGKR
jgi:CRP/FNR family transcriptional regulator, cyclic AMP receptor protein